MNKFLENPESLRYAEIEKILLDFKFVKMMGKGSHVKFSNPFIGLQITIPVHNNNCKPIYKINASKILYNYILDENSNWSVYS